MKTAFSTPMAAAAALALVFLGATSAQAQIAQWTFETSIPATAGPFAPEVGSGSASGLHAGAAAYSSPAGNGSAHSYSANTWAVGDYWQFQTSTLGFSGIALSWDQASSSTGPVHFQLQYSTDGTTFNTFVADYLVLTNATSANNEGTGLATAPWTTGGGRQSAYTYSYDLSGVTALNNQSSVYFRLVDDNAINAQGITVPASGTDRVDNFTVAVPEPSSVVLGGLGLLGLVFWRRAKK